MNNYIRNSLGTTPTYMAIPNLINIQRKSYNAFLQRFVNPKKRLNIGLQYVLKSIFGHNFSKYTLGISKYSAEECKRNSTTFSVPLYVHIKIIPHGVNINKKSVIDFNHIFYIGNIPLLTKKGTFIINGIEKVVVGELNRNSGIYPYKDEKKGIKLILNKGPMIAFEFDKFDNLYARINKKVKIPIYNFLVMLNIRPMEILETFYNIYNYKAIKYIRSDFKYRMNSHLNNKLRINMDLKSLINKQINKNIYDTKTKRILFKESTIIDKDIYIQLLSYRIKISYIEFSMLSGKTYDTKYYITNYSNSDIRHLYKGMDHFILEEDPLRCTEMNLNNIYYHLSYVPNKYEDTHAINIKIFQINKKCPSYKLKILQRMQEEGLDSLIEEYLETKTENHAYKLDENNKKFTFKKKKNDITKLKYLFSNIHIMPSFRMYLNIMFQQRRTSLKLDKYDILKLLYIYIVNTHSIINNEYELYNRYVNSIGHLLEQNYLNVLYDNRAKKNLTLQWSSFYKKKDVKTTIKHTKQNHDSFINRINIFPKKILNYLNTCSLSQYLEEINLLSSITHIRRITMLGPSGLSYENIGLDTRDIHSSYYGRICPIETPEGKSVGIVNSLTIYSRINQFGQIEVPYIYVKNAIITEQIHYLTIQEEKAKNIAPYYVKFSKDGNLLEEYIDCKYNNNIIKVNKYNIDYIELSARQVLSVSASLIPFLEHNDGNRALMGSNMQRQAVPLIWKESPIVGTGMEKIIGRDMNGLIYAEYDSISKYSSNNALILYEYKKRIKHFNKSNINTIIDFFNKSLKTYMLKKYTRTNQITIHDYKSSILSEQNINKKSVISEHNNIKYNELSLGHNIFIGFLSYSGHTFEDSIIISDKLLKNDFFKSIHLDEYISIELNEKEKQEIIIPQVTYEGSKIQNKKYLSTGRTLKKGDILVNKIQIDKRIQQPEIKFLRSILSKRDTVKYKKIPLKYNKDDNGIVIDINLFDRKSTIENDNYKWAIRTNYSTIDYYLTTLIYKFEIIENILYFALNIYNTRLNKDDIYLININIMIYKIYNNYIEYLNDIVKTCYNFKQIHNKNKKISLKMIKILIGTVHNIKVGDKITGRHGNKGVISKIVPVENMPYLRDGTSIDMILNPIGISSRMNIGQLFETHLGWSSSELGKRLNKLYKNNNSDVYFQDLKTFLNHFYINDTHFYHNLMNITFKKSIEALCNAIPMEVPTFDNIKDINDYIEDNWLKSNEQMQIIDGISGKCFDNGITTGYMYMLKLNHLIDYKIHSRTVGPYNIITQQPLRGKAKTGGQRMGEMEVWALQAYGAAYTLQEMLTIKSDSVSGRDKLLSMTLRSKQMTQIDIPESYHVLMKEFASLGFYLEYICF